MCAKGIQENRKISIHTCRDGNLESGGIQSGLLLFQAGENLRLFLHHSFDIFVLSWHYSDNKVNFQHLEYTCAAKGCLLASKSPINVRATYLSLASRHSDFIMFDELLYRRS